MTLKGFDGEDFAGIDQQTFDGSVFAEGSIKAHDGTEFVSIYPAVPDQDNLVAWWDMSDVEGSDGDTISSVADKSGSNNTLDGRGPTIATDAINGMRAAQFDGTDDDFLGPDDTNVDLTTSNAVYSVYVVWQSLDGSHTGYIITQTDISSVSDHGFSHLYESVVRFSLGGAETDTQLSQDINTHITGALVDRSTDDADISVDGSLSTASVGGATTPDNIRLGARGGGVYFDGYIGEVLIYDVKHDQTTHDAVYNYLQRWT